MKLNEDAATELPLNDERSPKPKLGRHTSIALRHLTIQRDAIASKIDSLTQELESLDASIKALSPE